MSALERRKALLVELGVVVLIALAACVLAAHGRSTYYNNYVRLADSILHGHLWIDWPGRTIDAAEYHGKHYGVDGPFPAVFMLPLVALWGTNANQTNVAIAGGMAGTALAWWFLARVGVARVPRLFLTLFLFAGTDLWWCSELGDVWFIAHVVAWCATFGALIELTGRRRGWLVALLAICAIESRFTLVMALPLYVYLLVNPRLMSEISGGGDASGGSGATEAPDACGVPVTYAPRRAILEFGAVIACGVFGWVAYNEAMWGKVVDIGHTLYYHQDPWGQPTGSPFRLSYLPYQLYSFFMRPPVLVEWLQQVQPPYFKVDPNGIALTFTSPALVLAFLARRPKALVVALWATIVLVAGPSFLYYLNGWYQFGMRHALDFEPFLLVLMALAVRRAMPLWGKVLCVYSALAGLWGVWFWNVYFRNGVN